MLNYHKEMNLRKLAFLFLMGMIMGKGLFAQEETPPPVDLDSQEQASFSPFVTGLRGEIRNNLLRLSWQDSPDLKGSVFIYRSLSPFEGGIPLEEGRPIEIPYGVESYIDEIDSSGTYYYFIAASDEERNHYIGFLLGNTISVEITESIGMPEVRNPVPAEPEEAIHGISNLIARIDDNGVIISFRYARTGNLILYRGTRPITRTADLLTAMIIRREAGPPFIDNPVPGIPYYYAIIPEEELVHGTAAIMPGVNATIYPIEAPIETSEETVGIRAVPLPLISLPSAMPETLVFEETPRHGELSGEAERALGNIPIHQRNRAVLKNSHIFPRDMEIAEGEDYLLSSIIRGSFSAKEWNTAKDEILRFLSVSRGRSSEARARYYLGQCYYFSYAPREALFEFLQARPVYLNETAEWIQACLNMMVE
jgi:hypothetical protein